MDVDTLLQTAALREDEGNAGVAETLYRLILDFDPHHALAALNLARLLQQRGKIADAIAAYGLMPPGDPLIALAILGRAGAYETIGRFNEAVADYQAYLVHDPSDAFAHLMVGRLLAELDEIDDALSYFRQAMTLDPGDLQIPRIAGDICYSRSRFAEAERFFIAAAALARETNSNEFSVGPEAVKMEFCLGMVAVGEGRSADVVRHMERILAMIPTMPGHEAYHDIALKYIAVRSVLGCIGTQQEINRAVERWTATLGPGSPSPPLPEDCANLTLDRLRLGIVSAWLGMNFPHPQDRLTAALSAGFERLGVTCFVYAIENGQAGAMPPGWRDLRHASSEQIAAAIRQDRCHALITLDLVPMSSGRPYLEPLAPLVASWMHGIASQGGLVDVIIADDWFIPPGEDEIFVEKILRLPESAFAYVPDPDGLPPVAPPCLERGHVTFGSLNRPNKIDDATIALWSQALLAAPETKLYLRSGYYSERESARILQGFIARGIDRDRIAIVSQWTDRSDFATAYGEIDIALDPVAFNGGITTFECLWHGIPVVTLPGATVLGRVSGSILTGCGHVEWIARDAGHWVDIVTALARQPADLARHRQELRPAMIASAMNDPDRMAAALARCLLRELHEKSAAGGQ